MKLLVPYVGACPDADDGLMRLAEFLGISCEPILLDPASTDFANELESRLTDRSDCLVVNPDVIREWTGGNLPDDLIRCLTSRFRYLLVHALSPDPFGHELARALSFGRIQSIANVAGKSEPYRVASDSRDVCGAFSGLSFGTANLQNDSVLHLGTEGPSLRTLISIGDCPFMATIDSGSTRIFFVASRNPAHLEEEISELQIGAFFSRIAPQAFALRSIFCEECWHPLGEYATFIVDDPLIRPRHGFLGFNELLELMETHNFSTSIGFIPRNYRRSFKETVQLFRRHSDRLSVCIHGNDHTESEFGSTDLARVNAATQMAEMRMRLHTRITGIPCSKVMAFPYEKFSHVAIKVLKARNFLCAVNSTLNPAGQRIPFTLSDLALPAVTKIDGFPLFLRKPLESMKEEDAAFALFFGRPIFISEHHDTFRQPEKLIEVVSMINRLAPEIQWTDLETAVTHSNLRRRLPDGSYVFRAYCSSARIVGNGESLSRFTIEWSYPPGSPPMELFAGDEAVQRNFEVTDSAIRLSAEIAGDQVQTFSVRYQNDYPSLKRFGIRWNVKAFLRRRLSELRDSYASRSPLAMKVFRVLQHTVASKVL